MRLIVFLSWPSCRLTCNRKKMFINVYYFKQIGQPKPLFVYFSSFQIQILQKKTVGFSGIRTRIDKVEGKHADHLTTTTAPRLKNVLHLTFANFLFTLTLLLLVIQYDILNKPSSLKACTEAYYTSNIA